MRLPCLIREMHAILLAHGRGSEKSPGEFRRSQNWIGAPAQAMPTLFLLHPSMCRIAWPPWSVSSTVRAIPTP